MNAVAGDIILSVLWEKQVYSYLLSAALCLGIEQLMA